IALVREAITDRARDNTPAHKEIYFFTDLQARTWRGLAKTTQGASTDRPSSIARELASIGEQAALVVVDLGQANVFNLAIESVSTSSAVVTIGHETFIDATLHNFSHDPRAKVRVELLVDNAVVAEQTVDVAAGGETSVRFTHRFSTACEHAVTIRTN